MLAWMLTRSVWSGNDCGRRRGPRLSRRRVDELKGKQLGVTQLKPEPDGFAFQRGQVTAVGPGGFPPQRVNFARLGGVARDFFGIFIEHFHADVFAVRVDLQTAAGELEGLGENAAELRALGGQADEAVALQGG